MLPACTKFCGHSETLRFSAPSKRPSGGSRNDHPYHERVLTLLCLLGPLVGLLHIFPGFLKSSEGVVIGLKRLTIFIDGAFSLARDVENLTQLDATPDFRPARLAIAIDALAISIGRGLIIPLEEEDFRDAIVGERTILVEIERLVEFHERPRQVSLLLHRLPAQNGGAQLHVAGVGQHMVVRIDCNTARTAEGFNRKRRSR